MASMRFRVEKLIRDKLPAIMRAQGLAVFDRRLDDDAFRVSLREKIVEEALEARAAGSRDELVGELADLTEVILALTAAEGLTSAEIEIRRLAKREERGGFDERVFNAAVEADDGSPAADYYLARPSQYPRVR
jgi:predicted house-cleaning noncanonical NTP pyrophosphatase (MazG superfamily)